MPRTLLDCGNCGPDFHSIRRMVEQAFGASVLQSHGLEDTLSILREHPIDLVTINRKLDRDYSDGIEVAKVIKSDSQFQSIPVMLITNYEEHQEAAVAIGCIRGFGKLALAAPSTREVLRPFLGANPVPTE